MSNIIINKRKIDNKHRPYIVAELSANHDVIHPKFFDKIIGKKAKKNLYKFNPLTKKDF